MQSESRPELVHGGQGMKARDVLQQKANEIEQWGVLWAFMGILGAAAMVAAGISLGGRYDRYGENVGFVMSAWTWLCFWSAMGSLLGGFWWRSTCQAHAWTLRGIAALLPEDALAWTPPSENQPFVPYGGEPPPA